MSDVLEAYYGNLEVRKEIEMGGKKYNKGYGFWVIISEEVSSFNLDGKYNGIKRLIGLGDADETVEIYGNDQLIKR